MQPPSSETHPTEHLTRRGFLGVTAAVTPVMLGLAAQAQSAQGTSTGPRYAPNGKVALVTGSSRGIGAAIAKRLARDGYTVAVNYVSNKEQASAVLRDIESAGGRAITHQAGGDRADKQPKSESMCQHFAVTDVESPIAILVQAR